MALRFQPTVRPPYEWDAHNLTKRLRQRDRNEVIAAVGLDVEGSIARAVVASGSLCWAVCNGYEANRLAWITGCAPIGMGIGSPWLMATDDVRACPGTLTKLTKAHVAQMLKVYPALLNYVDARNTDSVRWLARLGFTVEDPTPYGAAGLPFHRFTMGF